jgi:hypothetical protein
VVVYALPDCIMHGFGLALFHRTGPFRRRANYFVVLYRFFCITALVAWTRSWGLLLRVENLVQFAGLGFTLACTEAREAHLRRRYAASLAPPLKQKAA